MAWTNGKILSRSDFKEQLLDKIEHLKLDVSLLERKLDSRENELRNIHLAVREYGYITLTDETGDRITLVEKSDQKDGIE